MRIKRIHKTPKKMISNCLVWLFESSVAFFSLAGIYKLLYEKLTFFQWNRIFLIACSAICVTIFWLPIPQIISDFWYPQVEVTTFQISVPQLVQNVMNVPETPSITTSLNANPNLITNLIFCIYIIGFFIKLAYVFKSYFILKRVKNEAKLVGEESGTPIYLQTTLPTFSYFNKIFIDPLTAQLQPYEYDQVISHEKEHIRQKHSYDLLAFQFLEILFWFNPAISYLMKSLKAVHEYLVDEVLTSNPQTISAYGRLLIKLTTETKKPAFVHTFSETQIFHRITMLTKPKSNPMQKLRFFSILPLFGSLILLSACMNGPADHTPNTSNSEQNPKIENNTIAQINWTGNTKYTANQLNEKLGLRAGMPYDSLVLDSKLNGLQESLAALYMNQGYLFFRIDPSTTKTKDGLILNLSLFEGAKAKIGKIVIKGNKKNSTSDVLDIIEIREHDYFDRR